MRNAMIEKYTNKNRTFKVAPDGRFIKVYINGRINGFIWNNDKEIRVDGDIVKQSEFFK